MCGFSGVASAPCCATATSRSSDRRRHRHDLRLARSIVAAAARADPCRALCVDSPASQAHRAALRQPRDRQIGRGIGMTFVWPEALWLLLLVPILAALYVWILRRRKRTVLRYGNLAIV